jgi:transketolase
MTGAPTVDTPTDPASWNVATSLPLMFSLVAGEELADIADERADIVVLTADLMTSNRTDEFARRHPDRFVNVGIAEQNMVSIAAGMAASGLRPYVSTFASFASLLCAEQMRTDLAYPRMPVRVLAHHAGISMGFYGTSHHAVEDLAITRAMAGMTVATACDANSLRALLRATVDVDGPVYLRMGRGREKPVHASVPEVEVGKFIPVRDGTDVTVVATGIGVLAAAGAADALAGDGISVRVLDAAFVKPLDEQAVLAAAEETGAILTVEEHNVLGGLGGAVAEVLASAGVRCRFARFGIDDEYALIAPPTHLYRHYGFTADGVAARVRELLTKEG